MSDQTDRLLYLVKPYGLSDEEGILYLHLCESGYLTALQLSRNIKIARTKVYRILDKLREKELVEQRVTERGLEFGAVDPETFQRFVANKEHDIQQLKENLPDLVEQLHHLGASHHIDSKVLYYKGVEGLKQVSYNITHAKELVRVFEMEHLSDFLPRDFSEDVRAKLVERKILSRDLTNKSRFGDFTDVTQMIENYSEFRYIDPKKLKINFEVLIYNDVYATYTYKDNTIFCVEIYNQQLAQMQKELYDFIWNQARPMKFTSRKGAAKVI